jgi:hypothetical protein
MDYVVYWLFDETCTDPKRHGYVGVTGNPYGRFREHRDEQKNQNGKGSRGLPANFQFKVLFTGSETQCQMLEGALRPNRNVGWNKYRGSSEGSTYRRAKERQKSSHAKRSTLRKIEGKKHAPKSPEHREKIRQAALLRWQSKEAREKQSIDVKKGLRFIDRSGTNNPRWGQHLTESIKDKIRLKILERGGVSGRANPNYKHGRCVED